MNPDLVHQHRRVGPAPRLEQLPYHVLERIAEFLCRMPKKSWPRHSCVSAMHFALAAPTTFAPCLHAVIRRLNPLSHALRYDMREHGGFQPKATDVGGMLAINFGGRAQVLLVMPLRDHHRRPVVTVQNARSQARFASPVSCKWSLVIVPLCQVSTKVSISLGEPISTVPPRCQRLSVSGEFGGSWSSVVLPPTLLELHLENESLSTTLIDARHLANGFPPQLRTLAIINAFRPSQPDQDAILTLIFERAPPTLTSITLLQAYKDALMNCTRPAFVSLLHRLSLLSEFELGACEDVMGLDTALSALPKTGLRKLSLTFKLNASNNGDENVDAWTRLAASLPAVVSSFSVNFMGGSHDRPNVKARLLALVPRLPLATRQLTLSIGTSWWDGDVSALVPLAPTLRSFELCGSYDLMIKGKHLAPLLERLPKSVTRLDLQGSAMGGTAAMTALVKHLPPTLVVLDLTRCNLLLSDLNKFARYGHGWPATLRELILRSNGNRSVANTVSGVPPIDEVLRDTTIAPWVAKLPSALRFLDVHGMPVSDGMAEGVLARTIAQQASWRRLTMVVRKRFLTDEALAKLQTKVHVQIEGF